MSISEKAADPFKLEIHDLKSRVHELEKPHHLPEHGSGGISEDPGMKQKMEELEKIITEMKAQYAATSECDIRRI